MRSYLKVDYCGPWDGRRTALERSCAAGKMCMADQLDLRRARLELPEAVRWCARNSECAG
eukprot:SAG31_NODE_12059_length_972_cov_1.404353_1_plen_59_part_10